jgi:putative hydrolase of the HAD superfamily
VSVRTAVVIDAVIFDIDDTIVDFTTAMRNGLRRHLADVAPGLTGPDLDAALDLWLDLDTRHYRRYLTGELDFAGQRRARARDLCAAFDLPLAGTPHAQDGWIAAYLVHCEAAFRLFPDVRPALDRLDILGIRVGAMSNSNHAYQEQKLTRLGVRSRFATLTCCDDVGGRAKPDPAIFHAATAALGASRRSTAYVGDHLENDARAAQRAGLHGIWLRRTPTDVATAPVIATVATLTDIAELIAR